MTKLCLGEGGRGGNDATVRKPALVLLCWQAGVKPEAREDKQQQLQSTVAKSW